VPEERIFLYSSLTQILGCIVYISHFSVSHSKSTNLDQLETPALEIPHQQQADNIRGNESFVLVNNVIELVQCVAIVLSSCFENIYIN